MTIRLRRRPTLRTVTSFACTTILLGVVVAVGPGASWARADEWGDFQRVRTYLESLELNDLAIAAVEEELASPGRAERKSALASELADLYAGILINGRADPSLYQATLTKVNGLLDRFPAARTARLRVILLQADYQQAEALILKWKNAPGERGPLEEAARILASVTPQLKAVTDELRTETEAIDKQVAETDGAALDALDRKRLPLVIAYARAGFFTAWACYYNWYAEGQLGGTPPRDDLDIAATIFRKSLGLSAGESYESLAPEDLALHVDERARAVTGLGLVEAARGNLAAAERLFTWLDSPATTPAIRDEAAQWHFVALSQAGEWAAALALAEAFVAALPDRASQGRVNACAAFVQAGYADPSAAGDPTRLQLGRLGLAGLAKMRQLGIALKLAQMYEIRPAEGSEQFLPLFLAAQEAFTGLPKEADAAALGQVETIARRALAAPDASAQPVATAQTHDLLGHVLYKQGRFADAAAEFTTAFRAWRPVSDDEAVQSAFMIFASQYALVPKDAGPADLAARRALEAAATVVKEYPDTEQARRCTVIATQLRSRIGSGEAAAAEWEKFKPGDAQYPQAQVELARLRYKAFTAAKTPDEKTAAATALAEIARAVAKLEDVEAGLRFETLVRAIEAATGRLDAATTDQLMALADGLVGQVEGETLVADYHFRRLLRAQSAGDAAAMAREAAWLATEGRGTPFERAGLLLRAKELARGDGASSAADRTKLIAVLSRIVDLAGNGADVLKSDLNARVAAGQLLTLLVESGQDAAAADLGARLLAAFPNERSYLRQTGLAEFRLGRFAASLERWRTLVKGLPHGSPESFEAKYYQIACLAKSDPGGAGKVFKQFRLLYPKVEPADLEQKFQALGKTLP